VCLEVISFVVEIEKRHLEVSELCSVFKSHLGR
jgi:hypothetical protein